MQGISEVLSSVGLSQQPNPLPENKSAQNVTSVAQVAIACEQEDIERARMTLHDKKCTLQDLIFSFQVSLERKLKKEVYFFAIETPSILYGSVDVGWVNLFLDPDNHVERQSRLEDKVVFKKIEALSLPDVLPLETFVQKMGFSGLTMQKSIPHTNRAFTGLDESVDVIKREVLLGLGPIGIAASVGFCRNKAWPALGEIIRLNKPMQDDYLIAPLLCGKKTVFLIGILDGHGVRGEKAAAFVKKNIQEIIQRELSLLQEEDWTDGKIEKILMLACLETEYAWKEATKKGPYQSGGTTLSLNVIIDGNLWCVNVGDSRSCLLSQNAQSLQLSRDANLKDPSFRQGVIDRGGVITGFETDLRVNDTLAMATAFEGVGSAYKGITSLPRITKTFLEEGDYLVVASDGLWDSCSSEVALGYVKKRVQEGAFEELIAKELVEWVITHDLNQPSIGCTTDNIAVIVVKIDKSN